MKLKHILLPLIIIAGFYFSACQKDFTIDNNIVARVDSTVIPSIVDSNYLSKIIYVDIIGNLLDTTQIITYNYDASKRVVSTFTKTLYSPNYDETLLTKFFYNTNDTTPYKTIDILKIIDTLQPLNATNDTIVSFFTFFNNKRVKDSIVEFRNHGGIVSLNKRINIYQYQGNKIFSSRIDSFFNSSLNFGSSTLDTSILDINGNLVSNKSYVNSIPITVVKTASFTYDNNPNPFYKLSNFKAMPILPHGETFFNEMQSRNNRLHAIESGGSSTVFDQDLTNKYTYNANGYPKEINFSDQGGAYKIIFIYKVF